MNNRTYALRYFGIEIKNHVGFSDDDRILLMRIRESQRRANIGGIVHEPGNPIMSDIQVDEDFSKLCSERLI